MGTILLDILQHSFNVVLEIVGPEGRRLVGMLNQCFFPLGYMSWSAIGYFYRDWHQMELISVYVSLPYAIIVLLVPESARWLFSNGDDKKGKKITRLMARMNRKEPNQNMWEEAEKASKKKELQQKVDAKYSFIDLFRHPGLRILTLKVGFNWFVNTMVYFGISLNAGALAGDIFLNNIYAGLLEIASCTFCALIMDYVGRRLLLTVTLTGAGVALIASTIVNEYANGVESLVTLGVVFAFAGKALVSGSFGIIFSFTGELYPTVLRGNGIGFSSTVARFGGILSPVIIGMQDYATWLPNSLFGVFALIAGLLSLTFRDTTGRVLMETIEEAELFYAYKDLPANSKEGKTEDSVGYENKAVVVDEPDQFQTNF